ncbi:unnamed protein product [Clonostachys solani]|uniref:Uncharacterized protein n=1 Tax=Clonostachys solani TaxID=160281 RepID=A0A9N9ZJ65_9HYPO|nr:unnamed protein product [Clonostachys solani]
MPICLTTAFSGTVQLGLDLGLRIMPVSAGWSEGGEPESFRDDKEPLTKIQPERQGPPASWRRRVVAVA